MRVLITGGAGYIGSHVAKHFRNKDYDVIVVDNLATGNHWSTKWGEFIKGDVRDADLMHSVMSKDVDLVVHLAAVADVSAAERDPDRCFSVNIEGTKTVLSAMRSHGIGQILFSSTCAVYQSQALPMSERCNISPAGVYAESKLQAEKEIIREAEQGGIDCTIFRFFNVSGADKDCEIGEVHDPETHLIPIVLECAHGIRERVQIYGQDYPTPDGTAIRDYVHVEDIAAAHLLAAASREANRVRTFNLGTGSGYSVKEIIDVARRVTGLPIPVALTPRRAGDQARLTADSALAQKELGWSTAASDLPNIIDSSWKWLSHYRSTEDVPKSRTA